MKNKKIRYSDAKWFNDSCAQALHEGTEKWVESEATSIKTNGEQIFIKADPKERALKQIEKNRRKLDRLLEQSVGLANIEKRLAELGIGLKPHIRLKENG